MTEGNARTCGGGGGGGGDCDEYESNNYKIFSAYMTGIEERCDNGSDHDGGRVDKSR